MADIELWLSGLGAWAYFWAPAVMAAVSILPVPAEAPAMANGALFGPVVGTAITWTGAMVGAWASYEMARGWGRPLAERWFRADTLTRVDEVASRAGWKGLLVLRLIPAVAFTALNWGAGLCRIERKRFLWTTAVGILPGAVLFTTSGVGLSALWRRSPGVAMGVMMAVVVASVIWYWRRGR